MDKNRMRRKKRKIKEGKVPMSCEIIVGVEEFRRSQVRRSPLEELPFRPEPNLAKKVGNVLAKEIFEAYSEIQRGEQVKLDPHKKWEVQIVKVWMESLKGEKEGCLKRWKKMDDMDRRRRERTKLIEEWLPGSNQWE